MTPNDWIRQGRSDTRDPISNAFFRLHKAIIVYFGPVVVGLVCWQVFHG
jgi:hypothetical protein